MHKNIFIMKIFLFMIFFYTQITHSFDNDNEKSCIEFLNQQFFKYYESNDYLNNNNLQKFYKLKKIESDNFKLALRNSFQRFFENDRLYFYDLNSSPKNIDLYNLFLHFDRLGFAYDYQIALIDEEIVNYLARLTCCQKFFSLFFDTYFFNLSKIKGIILRLRKKNAIAKK